MSGELKACAHCGGRGEMDQFSPDAMDEWRVICADKSCEAWGPEASTRDAAITAWNRRAPAWEGIESAPREVWEKSQQVLCCHVEKRWVRFGRFYGEMKRWYYSGTSERSQWAEIGGDAPTHWMPFPPLPAAPADGGE